MCIKQWQHNIALFHWHQHNTNNILLTFFSDTQQQHNDMPQNVDIVGQQYIAINIVNAWIWNHLYIFGRRVGGVGVMAVLSDALIDQILMLNWNFVRFTCLFFLSNFRKISPQILSIYYVSMGEGKNSYFFLLGLAGGWKGLILSYITIEQPLMDIEFSTEKYVKYRPNKKKYWLMSCL